MKPLTLLFTIAILSACASSVSNTPTSYPTNTPYPTSTPYPTPTPMPLAETFLNALYGRIQIDDTIPPNGKDPILALTDDKGTFAFKGGLILQFIVDLSDNEDGFKKTAILLIGNNIITANEYSIALDGVEAVFYTAEDEPWLAISSVSPWQAEQLGLRPLHPDYIKRLLEAGVITPTPDPTY